jgi:cyclic beta-1,2-glucan synthetase
MSLLALGQAVLGARMQRRFLANPDFRAAALLLQERPPKPTAPMHFQARKARISPRFHGQASDEGARVIQDPNTPIPEVHLLSNGRYHVMVSAAGGGYSRGDDLALTRWREDPTSESFGIFCFIGDTQTRRVWSSSFQPTLRTADRYEAVFKPGRAEFRRQDDGVETHTEIAVSADHDLEVRRFTLTNRSGSPKSLLVTAYAEVVLAPSVTDDAHRAFSNLFVHTELAPDQGAILATRRPRSADEEPPWLFCLLRAVGDEIGACSYETDRGRFIGRGHGVRDPVAMEEWGPLSGTVGTVRDPCLALRRTVALAVDGEAQLDLIIGTAPTREIALTFVSTYQDRRLADRVFEVAAIHSRAVLGHIGVSEAAARRYGQLASALLFPTAAYRTSKSVLRGNGKGQPGLWAYGISGDLPIALLRVSDAGNLDLVRDLLSAHAYWRTQGLAVDLVIWNEDASEYRGELGEQIRDLIAAGTEAQWVDKPGGVFVRAVDGFPEEDRVLLQAAARIVLRDTDGPLDEQMKRRQRAPLPAAGALPAVARQTPAGPGERGPQPTRGDLIFANGTGGFTPDGREYVIELPPGRHTPAPWVNVIANPRLGSVVSERGSAYTWYGNAQLCRLTPWSNDAVTDASGEASTSAMTRVGGSSAPRRGRVRARARTRVATGSATASSSTARTGSSRS